MTGSQRTRPIARYRIPPGLPHLRSSAEGELEEGVVDKVSIRLSGAILYARSLSQFRAYLNSIARSPLDLFETRGGTHRNTLKIRRGWLFSGQVRFSLSAQRHGIYRIYSTAELHLNPSRFMAHNPDGGLRNFTPSDDMLRAREDIKLDVAANSLDGNDNYLPGNTYRRIMRSQEGNRALMAYLAGVQALVERELQIPFDGNPDWSNIESNPTSDRIDWDVAPHSDFQNCTVSCAEVYWERWVSDALSAVKELDDIIDPTVRGVARVLYPVRNVGVGIRREEQTVQIRPTSRSMNSLCFTAETGRNGIKLKAYAKQHRRVRMEIEYRGNLAQLLGATVGDYDGMDWSEYLFDLLRLAREDAATRISRFFSVIRQSRSVEPVLISTFVEVFQQLANACDGDQELASEVMMILVSGGGITFPVNGRRRSDDPTVREGRILRSIDVLRRSGVLQKSSTQSRGGRARRYVLAPKFRAALQKMNN